MSNINKDFKSKSSLRCMADGGVFRSDVNGVPTFTDARAAAPGATRLSLRSTGVTPAAPPTPTPASAPAPTSVAPSVIPAASQQQSMAASPVTAASPAPRSSLRQPPAMPAAPALAAPVTQTLPTLSVQGNPQLTTEDMSNLSGVYSSFSDRAPGFFADGGKVRGPGGPTDDKVGPVMLSDGEYVLPADTVRHVGKENLDALRDATHQPVFPNAQQRKSARRMADGGFMGDDPLGPRMARAPLPPGGSMLRSASATLAKAATPLAATAGALQAGAFGGGDMQTGYRDKFIRDLDATSSPMATAGADAARTMSTVGDTLTLGVAGRLGRGLSNLSAGQSFAQGFMSPSDRDQFEAQRAAQVLNPNAASKTPNTQAADSSVSLNTAMGRLRNGQDPGGGFAASNVPGILARANPDAGKPGQSAQQFIGVGKPSAPEDPIMAEIRSALRGGQRQSASSMPASNAMAINSHFDELSKRLSGMYSERGQGNLARRLLELEQLRANALDSDARNISALRGQDISRGNAEMQTRANALDTLARVANTRADQQTAQIKALQDAAKVGRDIEEKGFERYNKAISDMFIGADGKPDAAEQERFTSFLQASDPQAREKFTAMSPQDQSAMLQNFKVLYDMNKARNTTAARGGGAVTNRADMPADVREATWNDYWNKNLPLSDYVYSNLPFTNPNVVVSESGQPTLLSDAAVDANGNWDADKLELIRRRTGKDKNGRSALREK